MSARKRKDAEVVSEADVQAAAEMDGAIPSAECTPRGDTGELLKQYYDALAVKDDLAAKTKENNAVLEELQYKILLRLNEAGIDKADIDCISVTHKIELMPNIVDKDEFIRFAMSTGDMSLMVVSANKKSFREYFDENGCYPDGLDGFSKDTLSFRRKK